MASERIDATASMSLDEGLQLELQGLIESFQPKTHSKVLAL